jgi:hypothetical protein
MQQGIRFFHPHNEATRIDAVQELAPVTTAAIRAFCRRLGAPHLFDEVLLPKQQEGDAQIFMGVRDRPWPPWGLGARHVSALCQIQAIADESYAPSPVYVSDEDATNVGLIAAVYKEVLESIACSPKAEVNYVAVEGSRLAHHVFESVGFRKFDDVVLTEHARYYTYRIQATKLLHSLGLDRVDTPALLAGDVSPELLHKNASFHHTIILGSRAELFGRNQIAEIINLIRGGHAGKPGGVPGGTGRWGWVHDPEREAFFEMIELLKGGGVTDPGPQLLKYAIEHEQHFTHSTVVAHGERAAKVDPSQRKSRTLDKLGEFEALFANQIKEVLSPLLQRMKYPAFPVGRIEMQMTASGDGDYFAMHRDRDDTDTREISFVYFFHTEPRQFSGGELRIFDNEIIHGKSVPTDRSQLISPRQGMAVFFPSRNEHEILPVRVHGKEFKHSRFTVNGWIHRAT